MLKTGKKHARVFISHASANLKVAQKVESALEAASFAPWLDRSDIRAGALLDKQLQKAIKASAAMVLIWSTAASLSRWVAAEVLTAFHLDRFIIPCVLSPTALPQFLSRSVFFDLRKPQDDVLERLGEQLKGAPRSRNEFPSLSSYQDQKLTALIYELANKQAATMQLLGNGKLRDARKSQAKLEPRMRAAEKRWRYDPLILNLAGYHRKNSYMLKHWDEYCAGRFPPDPLLHSAERFFFETLFVNPVDPSALNGLGNILLFSGELDASEFFVARAVKCAESAARFITRPFMTWN